MRLAKPLLGLSALLSAAVVAGVAVHQAAAPATPKAAATQAPTADLFAPTAATPTRAADPAPRVGIAARGPTEDEVGDVDSFGRPVRWLGVTQMNLTLSDTCPADPGPDSACAVLAPAPAATAFQFTDVARIVLPPKAADSLLCYWFSPYLTTTYANPTAAPVLARLRYSPTLTVENEVLDDPSLIDPTTGLPFGGRLTTGMTSSELFEVPVPAGAVFTQRQRDSAVCIAGFVTKRNLVQAYGLSNAQAREFFRKKTTVRMNIASGSAQYVSNATLVFGFRIVGD